MSNDKPAYGGLQSIVQDRKEKEIQVGLLNHTSQLRICRSIDRDHRSCSTESLEPLDESTVPGLSLSDADDPPFPRQD